MAVALLACACAGCGGGGGSSAGSSAPNSVPITVDGGPAGALGIINVPYVSVTVCVPPGMAACRTIDHVVVDTGSSGLRLLQSALGGLVLPAVTDASTNALGECVNFADGFVWGSVRQADIHLSQEVASGASIQVIGDTSAVFATTPSDCSAGGNNENTVASLGANGILGVGLFTNDCDACIGQIIPATYYSCPASGCVNALVNSAQVVKNPVALFKTENNGVLIDLRAVGPSGAANLAGALIFGIDTQSNNALGNAKKYSTDSAGNFLTSYKSTLMTSFIDSGSNALFFADATITPCATSIFFYCPTSPLAVSATNTGALGSPTGPVSVTIVDVDALSGSVTAANVGGSATGTASFFDWGLPFFFGRPVFTAIALPGAPGSYWAY
jgi:Protein of unknown function (DUF3443)